MALTKAWISHLEPMQEPEDDSITAVERRTLLVYPY